MLRSQGSAIQWAKLFVKVYGLALHLVRQSDIEAACQLAGLRAGDVAVVHVSLSRLGYVVGGAETVVRALLNVVGETGSLMAPAQTWLNLDPERGVHGLPPETWPLLRQEWPGFDPAVTASIGMGAVAEQIRTWPGSFRSLHPARSWAAIGAKAADLMAEHDLDDVHGERSPLGAAIRAGAKVVLMGVGYDKCTALHLAETRTESKDAPTLCERGWLRRSGERLEVTYTTLKFDDADFPSIGAAFDTEMNGFPIALGKGELRIVDAVRLVDFASRWMQEQR